MKYTTYCLLLIQATTIMHATHAYELKNNREALAYCKQEPQSFVSIVWPIAQGKSEQIEQIFNQHGQLKYKKIVTLNPSQAFYLLKTAHPHIPNMKEHVTWYFPPGTMNKPARVYVLKFDSTNTAVTCKHAVRKIFKGLQYRSIHIVDTHPETIELAEYFFTKKRFKNFARMFTGTCLLQARLPLGNSLRFYLPVQVNFRGE